MHYFRRGAQIMHRSAKPYENQCLLNITFGIFNQKVEKPFLNERWLIRWQCQLSIQIFYHVPKRRYNHHVTLTNGSTSRVIKLGFNLIIKNLIIKNLIIKN